MLVLAELLFSDLFCDRRLFSLKGTVEYKVKQPILNLNS